MAEVQLRACSITEPESQGATTPAIPRLPEPHVYIKRTIGSSDIKLGSRRSMTFTRQVMEPSPGTAAAGNGNARAPKLSMKINLPSSSLIIIALSPCGSEYVTCTASETKPTFLTEVVNIESVLLELPYFKNYHRSICSIQATERTSPTYAATKKNTNLCKNRVPP